MAQQIIIPASTNQTKLELNSNSNGQPVVQPVTFPASTQDTLIDVIVTEITTTTTSTTSTTTKVPTTTTSTSTTSTTTKSGDTTFFDSTVVTQPKLNDGEPLEVGLKFQASKAGFIKGIRYYKAAGSSGVRTANLWDSAGTKVGSAQFIETASGWQQVLFSTPVSINANATYTASIYSPSGDYVSKVSGLTSNVISGFMTTVSGNNGVFKYGTSGFPSQAYQNSNYYVDVIYAADTSSTTTTTTKASTTTTTTKASTTSTTTQTTGVPSSGVEGFGVNAVGGSTVVNVANKSQFDAAMNNPNGKIIKFTANASFTGRYDLSGSSYVTIDGNGFDVTIDNANNGDGISIGSGGHHIIIRGIRVINAGNDCINVVDGGHDVLIEHCSAYGGSDGNIDVAADDSGQSKNVTVQWCILGENHGSGRMLVTGQSVSVHHNLFVGTGSGEGSERNPFVHSNYSPVGSPNVDFRNNVLSNWGRYGSGIGYRATGNFVNNYYNSNKAGAIDPSADPSGATGSYYVSGNVQSGGANINLGGGNHSEFIIPAANRITSEAACTAAARVVASVGTSHRNSYEQSIINSINLANCH